MVKKGIKEIDIKALKQAKGFMAVLDLLGLTEEDLLLLKDIKDMKAELVELRAFRDEVNRYLRNTTKGGTESIISVQEAVKSFAGGVEEFRPNGR